MNDLPKRRYQHQKYVYANIEAAANYPICSEFWNSFFNWTWSYRTDSDLYWPYFSIKDSMNNFIGPKKDMNWINIRNMDPIDEKLQVSLSSKTKAAAWFASNCETQSLRENFVEELLEKMKLYGLELDTFGECGKLLQCPRNKMSRCHRMLDKYYYFYLAFENSISEDYVSEKILHALLHNTVPVVLGGANYSRFLPEGAYLNALELGATKLAQKMYELIQNPKAYNNFFRWKKYYSYHYTHESPETDVYCRICEYLNNNKLVNKESVYQHFNHWWTPQRYCSDVINVKIQ
ncbi:alpha-(1,3)-fucosyltransferase C-like isoform X2 [Maniola hyperantus]